MFAGAAREARSHFSAVPGAGQTGRREWTGPGGSLRCHLTIEKNARLRTRSDPRHPRLESDAHVGSAQEGAGLAGRTDLDNLGANFRKPMAIDESTGPFLHDPGKSGPNMIEHQF